MPGGDGPLQLPTGNTPVGGKLGLWSVRPCICCWDWGCDTASGDPVVNSASWDHTKLREKVLNYTIQYSWLSIGYRFIIVKNST